MGPTSGIQPYWQISKITAWALQFMKNSIARVKKRMIIKGKLTAEELLDTRNHWESNQRLQKFKRLQDIQLRKIKGKAL